MKAKLSRHLILWVGLPASLLFGGVLWVAAHRSFDRVVQETEQITRGLARYHAAEIDGKLSRASQIPRGISLMLELGLLDTEEKLNAFLRQLIEETKEVYGSCVAFEPGTFKPELHYFAPYYYKKDGHAEFVQLGNPDYDYFRWEWYTRPKTECRALWTEPYFDDGGGNTVMTTYSAPFRRNGEFWGIATIDIAMSELMKDADRLEVGRSGYTFIVSQQGRFLAYPDDSKIMQARIQDVNPELGRLMMAGEQGFLRTKEPVRGQSAWIAYVPIQNGQLSLAIVYPESEVLSGAFHLQTEMIAMGVVGLLALIAAVAIVARLMSRPIAQLSQAARGVAEGNLDQELAIEARSEEVQQLTESFRKMTRELKMRMEELRYTTALQERIEGELSAARSIQRSLLAKRFPAFPDRREIDIRAIVQPARAVGGDFYDFYFADEDSLCLLMADVAGKGVPAALFMALSKTLLKANAAGAISPAEMLAKVNNELCDEGSTLGMFVSLVFAILNVRTGRLQLCNAGHPAPLRIGSLDRVEPLEAGVGVALGAWRDLHYGVVEHTLSPGDTLFFYTDGVTEALDPREQFYGASRLHRLLAGLSGRRAEEVIRSVSDDVRDFSGTHEQADDIALMAVRWLGPDPPSTS